MNHQQFFDLLNGNYSSIEKESEPLENAISEYPYFANLHVIKALALHEQQNEGFKEALHKAAARTISQRRLKELVEGPMVLELEWETQTEAPEAEHVEKPLAEEVETESEPIEPTEDKLETIEEHDAQDTDSDNRWAGEIGTKVEPIEPTEEVIEVQETEILAIEPEDEESSELMPPPKNEFGFKFVRKAKIKSTNKTERKSENVFDLRSLENKKSIVKKGNRDAIDQFLEKSPSISSPAIDFGQNNQLPDLAAKSVALGEEIITENMAHIYMKQRDFARALNIYRKLELKFPEKSDYFAALIKNLENTIV